MAINFNPHQANNVLGPEIVPRNGVTGETLLPILSLSQAVIETFAITSSQTVDGMSKAVRNQAASPGGGGMLVEVVTAGQEIPANQLTATYIPNGGTSANVERASDSSIDTNAYLGVITGTDSVFNASDLNATLALQFNTVGVLTGKRILAVRLFFQATALGVADAGPPTIDVSMSGAPMIVPRITVGTDGVYQTYEADFGEIWPVGNGITTVTNITSLSTGTPRIDLILNAGDSDYTVFVNKVWVEVDYADENRLARDVVSTGTTGAVANHFWTPHKPDGTANFAKVNGTFLSVITRQPRYGDRPIGFSTSIYVVANPTSSDLPPGMPDIYPSPILLDNGAVFSLGTKSRRLFLENIFFVGSTPTPESQPYTYMLSTGDASWTLMRQRYTMPYTYNPVGVRLVGDYIADAHGVAPTLTVNVKRASDGVLFCSGTLTQAQADAFPKDPGSGNLRLLQVPFTTLGTLVSGTQYYVEVVASGVRPAGWTFPLMYAIDGNGESITFGGSTDYATLDTAVRGDFPWLLYPAVASPAGFAATPANLAFDPAVADCAPGVPASPAGCFMDGIPYVAVTWTPTALGALFDHYLIQREDAYSGWQDIAYIDLEATAEFDDYEARIGVVSSYRVQAVTVIGLVGAFTASAAAAPVASGVGLTFTTNYSPLSGVAYSDTYENTTTPERTFGSPEAAELTTQRFAGRDYVVAFQPCERRGDIFTRTLLLNALGTPAIVGVHAYDALRDLAKLGVPYVCVRDEEGDRWLAAITVPDFRIRNPRQFYLATVTVVEVQDVPTPPTV